MSQYLSFFLKLAVVLILPAKVWGAFDHEHSVWHNVVTKYVHGGLVDYKSMKSDRTLLDTYIGSLNQVSESDFEAWSVNQQKAFLINAYNAYTVRLIVDNFPVASIRDIGGWFINTWNKEFEFIRLFGGKVKTLDPIEKEYLLKRPSLKDKRIHAAVNCASISCPNLRMEAYVPGRLDDQLDEAVRDWLRDKTKNNFTELPLNLSLSMIFSWYASDFGSQSDLLEFLKKFGPPEASKIDNGKPPKLSYLTYNWGLNQRN